MTAVETPGLAAVDEYEAVEQLHALGCTDGLPVIVPTHDRVDRMVLATGHDADLILGDMGPNMGSCTIEKLAACAVMAGCLPDHAPVVVAAARAILDPKFDLTEVQATTHSIAPLIVVNGPAREWCGGIHGGFGALGPGYRANASIGRAVRLAMINIGGGRSGTSDMALLGHPGKFSMCLAEDEANSPFEPMHTLRGFEASQSTVTVLGTDAPHSVMAVVDADDPSCADRMFRSFASGFANVTTNNTALSGGQAALALNPDHAAFLAGAGYSLAQIRDCVVAESYVQGRVFGESAGYMGRKPTADKQYRCFENNDDLLVFVAGGGGLYSVAFPTWCAGPHKNRAITFEIEVGQSCEIPGLAISQTNLAG